MLVISVGLNNRNLDRSCFKTSHVFEFSIFGLILKLKNWKNSEFFSKLVNFKAVAPFKEALNVRDFRVFNFQSFTKIKKLENSKISQDLKYQSSCFTSGSWKFLRFSDFKFCSFYWNRKLQKWRNFFKTLLLNFIK